jgi:hypothetical protein
MVRYLGTKTISPVTLIMEVSWKRGIKTPLNLTPFIGRLRLHLKGYNEQKVKGKGKVLPVL